MIDLDSKQLRSFLCLAAERSFSKAARQIGCSQATMSIRIQKLEEALGLRLFDRSPHEVTLTAEGRDVLPDIRAMVDLQDRMYERLQSRRVFGKVRLGVADGYEILLLPRLLKNVLQDNADAELDVHCGPSRRLQQMMDARTLDIAVVTLSEPEPSAVTICHAQLHWVSAPGFEIDPLAPVPIAWHEDDCFFRSMATAALKGRGMAFREVLCSADARIIRATVEAETAIAVLPECAIPDTLSVLSAPSLLPSLGTAPIQLLERPTLQSEAAAAVKQEIVRTYREAGLAGA